MSSHILPMNNYYPQSYVKGRGEKIEFQPSFYSDRNISNEAGHTDIPLCEIVLEHPPLPEIRASEQYLGYNRVCFNERVVMGPQTCMCACTCGIILVPTAVFFGVVCTNFHWMVAILDAFLVFCTLLTFFRTATTDPGILRRNEAPADSAARPNEFRVEMSDGSVVYYRYCRTCCIYRGPRASHCHICDNCVERFDHHCPWTGTCIGLQNYRFFVQFLVCCVLTAVFDIFFCVGLIFLRNDDSGHEKGIASFWSAAGEDNYASFFLALFFLLIIVSLAPLCVYHLYLITLYRTTREAIKRKSGRLVDNLNFSKGSWLVNCTDVCCHVTNPFADLNLSVPTATTQTSSNTS